MALGDTVMVKKQFTHGTPHARQLGDIGIIEMIDPTCHFLPYITVRFRTPHRPVNGSYTELFYPEELQRVQL